MDPAMNDDRTRSHQPESPHADPVAIVIEALRGLQFGTVKLIVQDGILVRVERTENRQVVRRSSQV